MKEFIAYEKYTKTMISQLFTNMTGKVAPFDT